MNEIPLKFKCACLTCCETCICSRLRQQCLAARCIWLWGRGRIPGISAGETFVCGKRKNQVFFRQDLFFFWSERTYLPDLVITISVPRPWNFVHRSLDSRVTLGSSVTPSSSASRPEEKIVLVSKSLFDESWGRVCLTWSRVVPVAHPRHLGQKVSGQQWRGRRCGCQCRPLSVEALKGGRDGSRGRREGQSRGRARQGRWPLGPWPGRLPFPFSLAGPSWRCRGVRRQQRVDAEVRGPVPRGRRGQGQGHVVPVPRPHWRRTLDHHVGGLEPHIRNRLVPISLTHFCNFNRTGPPNPDPEGWSWCPSGPRVRDDNQCAVWSFVSSSTGNNRASDTSETSEKAPNDNDNENTQHTEDTKKRWGSGRGRGRGWGEGWGGKVRQAGRLAEALS